MLSYEVKRVCNQRLRSLAWVLLAPLRAHRDCTRSIAEMYWLLDVALLRSTHIGMPENQPDRHIVDSQVHAGWLLVHGGTHAIHATEGNAR